MKNILTHLRQNILIKVSALNAVGVLLKLVSGFVTIKLVAILLGEIGIALLGNLKNFFTAIHGVSTLGLYQGVVKYTAENKEKPKALQQLFSTIFTMCACVIVLVFLFLLIFSGWLNDMIFGKEYDFTFYFLLLGFLLPIHVCNILFLAILNGFSRYKAYVIINGITQVIATILIVLLVWSIKFEGVVISLILYPCISSLMSFYICKKENLISKSIFNFKIYQTHAKQLASYTGMAMVSATLLPTALILIRNYISQIGSISESGYWEAMRSISNQYMIFVTTLLTLYILPKFSEIQRKIKFRKELQNFYKTILPLFGIMFILIYIFRFIIINILFSKSFLPMHTLFFWQLLGDFFKITSWVLAYQFIAKKMFWNYISTEIISVAILYVLSIYCIQQWGVVGAAIAHCICYAIYLVMVLWLLRKSLFKYYDYKI